MIRSLLLMFPFMICYLWMFAAFTSTGALQSLHSDNSRFEKSKGGIERGRVALAAGGGVRGGGGFGGGTAENGNNGGSSTSDGATPVIVAGAANNHHGKGHHSGVSPNTNVTGWPLIIVILAYAAIKVCIGLTERDLFAY